MFTWIKSLLKKNDPVVEEYKERLEILDINDSFLKLEEKNTQLLFEEPVLEEKKQVQDPYTLVVEHILSGIKEQMSSKSKQKCPSNVGLISIPYDSLYCFRYEYPDMIGDLHIEPYMETLMDLLDERISFEIGRVDHGIEFRYTFGTIATVLSQEKENDIHTYYIYVWFNLNMPYFEISSQWPEVNGVVEDICKGRSIEIGDKTFNELYLAVR